MLPLRSTLGSRTLSAQIPASKRRAAPDDFQAIRDFIAHNMREHCELCTGSGKGVMFEPMAPSCKSTGIVFLGLCPGDSEYRAGRPFADLDDQLCRNLLEEMGLNEHGILLFNACCCVHAPQSPPTAREIYHCFDNLEYALAKLPPYAILVPVGTQALRRMGISDTPREAMDKAYRYGGRLVLPVVHISEVTQGRVEMARFKERLKQIQDVLENRRSMHVFPHDFKDASSVKACLADQAAAERHG